MTFKWKIKESRVVSLMLICGLAIAIWGTLDSLDAKFYYTSEEALEFLHNLSSKKRINYFWTQYIDIIFLTAYSQWFFLLSRRFYPKNLKFQLASLVPGLFDGAETITILLLLSQPVVLEVPGWLGVTTGSKWITVILVAGMLINGYRKSPEKRGSHN